LSLKDHLLQNDLKVKTIWDFFGFEPTHQYTDFEKNY
jgi:hypothetical protein